VSATGAWLNDSLLAAVAAGLLGVYSLARNPRRAVNRSFAAFLLSAAVLCVGSMTIYHADSVRTATLWGYATRWSLMVMPACFLSFCLYFAELAPRWRRRILAAAFSMAAVLVAASFTRWMVPGWVRDGAFLKPVYGPGYRVFIMFFLACWGGGIAVLIRAYRSRGAYQRNRIKLFLIAVCLAAGSGATSLLLLHWLVVPLAAPAVLVSTPLMAASFMRHRLLDVSSYMRLGVAYLLGLVMLVPVCGVLAGALYYFHDEPAPEVLTILAACLLGTAFLFPKPRTWTLPGFERRHVVDRRRLKEEAATLGGLDSVDAVAHRAAGVLRAATSAQRILVYVCDGQEPGYHLAGRSGDGERPIKRLPEGHPALRWLHEWGEPILLQDLALERRPGDGVGSFLRATGVELAVPVRTDEDEKALLLLSGPADGRIYEPRDLRALARLGRATAGALQAARQFSALQRERQLRDVTQAVAVVAHELRNALVPARTFLELLPDKLEDPEFVDDFRQVALAQVQHCFEMVREFRDLNVDSAPQLAPVDLAALIDRAVRELRPKAAEAGTEILIEDDGEPVWCQADQERLGRAILNLLANALAHAGGRPVALTVGIDDAMASGDRARAVATFSNASVIPADVLPHVFVPFFTTRTKGREPGTGLGLPISQRIVRAHGGSLTVRSTELDGTVFTLAVPGGAALRPERQPAPAGRAVPPLPGRARLAAM